MGKHSRGSISIQRRVMGEGNDTVKTRKRAVRQFAEFLLCNHYQRALWTRNRVSGLVYQSVFSARLVGSMTAHRVCVAD